MTSPNLIASGSPEKICSFLFCVKCNLHPSERINFCPIPQPYTVLSHIVPWTLTWCFIICPFKWKWKHRGRRYSEWWRYGKGKYWIWVGSYDNTFCKVACRFRWSPLSWCLIPRELPLSLFTSLYTISFFLWDTATGKLDHVKSDVNAQLTLILVSEKEGQIRARNC